VLIRRLAIGAPKNMVWTIYDNWRPWDRVLSPRFFQLDDVEAASEAIETAKLYAKEDAEFRVDPKKICISVVELIRLEPHKEDLL